MTKRLTLMGAARMVARWLVEQWLSLTVASVFAALAASLAAAQIVEAVPRPFLIVSIAILFTGSVVSIAAVWRTRPPIDRSFTVRPLGIVHHQNQPKERTSLRLRFMVHNASNRPLHYKVDAISWEVMGLYPQNPTPIEEAAAFCVPGEGAEFASTPIPYDTPVRPIGRYTATVVVGERFRTYDRRITIAGSFESDTVADGKADQRVYMNITKYDVAAA